MPDACPGKLPLVQIGLRFVQTLVETVKVIDKRTIIRGSADRHHVLPTKRDRVHLNRSGNIVYMRFQGEGDLRNAITPHRPRRRACWYRRCGRYRYKRRNDTA